MAKNIDISRSTIVGSIAEVQKLLGFRSRSGALNVKADRCRIIIIEDEKLAAIVRQQLGERR